MATSNSEIREVFDNQIEKLKEDAANIAAELDNNDGRRLWQIPDLGDWDGDLQNLEDISKAFNRDENAQDVIDAHTKKGTDGDAAAGAIQGDVLACLERAYRARHEGSIRAKMHAVARRKGHGHDNGPIKGALKGYVERILVRAKLGDNNE